MRLKCALIAITLVSSPVAAADPAAINRIADQAMNHGQVVETAAYLTDRIGGRLTNSPAMREAERWTQAKFKEWGLRNVHLEGFEFGRGWWIESSRVRMTAPRPLALHAIPIAWTPPTDGAITAPVIVAPMTKEDHFTKWRGKLAGKIVLVSLPKDPKDEGEAPFKRLSGGELAEKDEYRQPVYDPSEARDLAKWFRFGRRLDAFLKAEGAIAWARMAQRDNGLVHGEGYSFRTGETPSLPAVELAAEDYRRLTRLAKTGPVTIEIDSKVHFDDSDSKGYNIIAEIPGTDPKAGYVMAGAHIDSWVAADGAADNAAGSAVVMEAARILSAIGVRPKRTIRFALWSGEEQGLFGSYSYVRKHLVTRPAQPDPEIASLGPWGDQTYPITPLPGFRDLVAYFNMDNGSGKLRGIYAEGNFAAVPMLKEWISPLASMGVTSVVAKPTGSTDHIGMAELGLPAFQFIQDPLDYGSRAHHSSLDTFDHLRAQDLRQAATVMASLLLSAADSDKPLPRNVLPTQPSVTRPFDYEDPDKD
ncbi:M20/M25/M40 family metallo-hydrolase [Sphingosinicella rhizophila]|uniref:Carboxypeptidase Q n=1 Tax=Sphingosinicella rhizophila TaxID=3050082 RepID=A0ABU3Q448_9SPHN|nr:M20/M25/M40 family metallo-hydrolase [Sphingosinicella sp. GR2756]MDT9598192.1 M20/M25/M40 family metallo-hydrolase [Sphingosinicella sp. GR2756]